MTVTPQHTLERVRNNQRRHRARRREHIATLEERLQAAEAVLEDARKEIMGLNHELDKWRRGELKATPPREQDNYLQVAEEEQLEDTMIVEPSIEDAAHQEPSPAPTLDLIQSNTVVPFIPPPPMFILSDILPLTALITLEVPPTSAMDIPQLPPTPLPSRIPSPPASSCCTTSESSSCSQPTTNHPAKSCTLASPPPTPLYLPDLADNVCPTTSESPDEPTTLCTQAYILLEQQNFKGVDPNTIRKWLWNGFRRARREGEGCRVETVVLFQVLDWISGT